VKECPECNGYGMVPYFSFIEMAVESQDCPKCGGEEVVEEVEGGE